MSKKNKDRVNVVYSTNPNFGFEEEIESNVTHEKQLQPLKITIDRKQRKGKSVTIINGYIGNEGDIQELAKVLKTKCGVGGSAKDGEILIQGEHQNKVFELLINMGYTKTKKIGN